MLTLYRRHTDDCPNHGRVAEAPQEKCACVVWVRGHANGRPVRKTLKTRNWAVAGRKLTELEIDLAGGKQRQTVPRAIAAFLASFGDDIQPATKRKYRHFMGCFEAFCEAREITTVDEVDVIALDSYKIWRSLSPLTWSKELQLLRSFFAWCAKRKWCDENPAKEMRMPKDPKGRERVPYTADEIDAILEAANRVGQESYERLRARALILLMRYYGLRVSDAALLARSRVRRGQIAVRALKNGAWLWMPLYPEVASALEALPLPAGRESPYYFWTGLGEVEGHCKTVIDSLACVYRLSKVEQAHSHRFRHTLATELLSEGAEIEAVADLLGDAPKTIRRHYKHFIPAYQERTADLLDRVHGKRKRLKVVGGKGH
jgi:integrase/recombinase XerC